MCRGTAAASGAGAPGVSMFLTAFKLACTQTQRLCDAHFRCMCQAMQARFDAD